MTVDDHRSLRELEDAHRDQDAMAARRTEQAEEYVSYYRSRMRSMQEDFYTLAAHMGAADDPGFRATLAQIVDEADANVRAAARVVARLDEDHHETRARHSQELESFQEARERRQ